MTRRSISATAVPETLGTVSEEATSSHTISLLDELADNEMLEDPSVRWNPVALKIALSDSDDSD